MALTDVFFPKLQLAFTPTYLFLPFIFFWVDSHLCHLNRSVLSNPALDTFSTSGKLEKMGGKSILAGKKKSKEEINLLGWPPRTDAKQGRHSTIKVISELHMINRFAILLSLPLSEFYFLPVFNLCLYYIGELPLWCSRKINMHHSEQVKMAVSLLQMFNTPWACPRSWAIPYHAETLLSFFINKS